MTDFSENRAYAFMRKLSFVRPSGSAEEARAAEMIAAELRTAGLEPRIEVFPTWTYEEEPCRVEVLAPYRTTIEAAPVGLSGVTPPEGVTGELVFVETGEEEFLDGVEGKIALRYGLGGAKKYEAMAKAMAKAVICIGEPGKDLLHLSVWDNHFKRFGKMPSVFLRYEDALKMLREGAREVTVVCRQREIEGQSRNVVVEIPGTGRRGGAAEPAASGSSSEARNDSPGGPGDEVILLCGHFDTVPGVTGAHDNAAGSAILVELARLVAARPARRTVRLVWFGAEELGLYGSQIYVRENEKALDRVKLVINVDVAGGTIGRNECMVTGPESLKAYMEALGKEIGLGLTTRLGIMSSDSIPFAHKGVPSVNLARGGGVTTSLHTPADSIEHTDAYHLGMLGRFVEVLLDRAANAKAYPFERDIPESVRKDIAKYREESMGLEKETVAEANVPARRSQDGH